LPPDAPFTELAEGPYLVVASYMDDYDLRQTDACCRQMKTLGRELGLWRSLGGSVFHALELEGEGMFECREVQGAPTPHRSATRINWKRRYSQFKKEILGFREPFDGKEITEVKNPDEVVYCSCKISTGILTSQTAEQRGVYLEVAVIENADNLSLVVVDFDHGEKSSVTFSPDTGAVIKETKVQEEPRRVRGAYIQPLQAKTGRFEGKVGLYVHNGHIAFFRKCGKQEGDTEEPQWESTGFIIDVEWAEGRRLTPCLAFRDEGSYRVHVAGVDSRPPIWPKMMPGAYDMKNWTELNWDAVEPM